MKDSTRTLLGEVPEYQGGWQELAQNTWAWIQPNGKLGESNAGLICGEGSAVLIDTLWDPVLTERMLAAAPCPRENITLVVNTHGDGDHCWGNQLVSNGRIIAAQGANEDMREFTPRQLRAVYGCGSVMSGLLQRFPGGKKNPVRKTALTLSQQWQALGNYQFKDIKITPATEFIEGAYTLEVGGRVVELHTVGPAHTRSDLIVHVPDVQVVFAGDILFHAITPILWAGPVSNWISALDRIQSYTPHVIVPGHGALATSDAVNNLRHYWQLVHRLAVSLHQQGRSVVAAAQEIMSTADFVDQDFHTWHNPERLGMSLTVLFDSLSGRSHSSTQRMRAMLAMARIAALCEVQEPTRKPRR